MTPAGSLFATLALSVLTSTELAAAEWIDCKMMWSEVAANREINTSVTMPLRYHEAAGVMEFDKIKLQVQVDSTNSETLEDGTRIRLALWREDDGYRMSYVWQDMNNGTDIELYGREWFMPNVVWQGQFFGGSLNCD